MSQPPDVPGPYGPGPTPPDPDGAATPGWATPSPGSPPPLPQSPDASPDASPVGPPPGYGPPSGYGPPAGYGPPPGYAPGTAAGLPPGVKPKRFSGGYVVLGMLACWAVMLLPTSVALGFLNAFGGSGGGAATLGIGGLSLVAPLVVGAVLVGRGSPQRRGFGLGMFVGWGLFVVVGAGACIALLAALSSTGD